jgi:hypothetical protein
VFKSASFLRSQQSETLVLVEIKGRAVCGSGRSLVLAHPGDLAGGCYGCFGRFIVFFLLPRVVANPRAGAQKRTLARPGGRFSFLIRSYLP